MKKLLAVLMLLGASLHAQTTSHILGTVTDTDGIVWANGTWKMDFTPNPSQPNEGIYNINGTPLSPTVTHQHGALDNLGKFSVFVYPNTIVVPAGSTWTITVCPNAVTACGSLKFTAPQMSPGTAMDLSAQLTPVIPPPRFAPVAGTYGYADLEAVLSLEPGSTYWNVTSTCQRFYDKTAGSWACASSGGGGGGATSSPPPNSVQIADASTGFTSDPYITIDKVLHKVYVGGPTTGNSVNVFTTPPIPSSWNWDWSTPNSALISLGPVPYNDIIGPNGNTQYLCMNGASPSVTTLCNASATGVTSVGINPYTITSGTQPINVSGSPITSAGVFNLFLNVSGTERSLVTSGGAGTNGSVAVWNSAGGLSAVPMSSITGGTDYYWTVTAPCSVGGGNNVACINAGTAVLITSLPGNMPDASYQLFITADVASFSGSAAPSFMCTGLNANSSHPSYSLPTTPAVALYYHCTSVLSNGGTGGSPVVYFHAHHN